MPPFTQMKVTPPAPQPGAWTQGAYARDNDGDRTGSTSVYATCWCMYGALSKTLEDDTEHWFKVETVLTAVVGQVPEFNDAPDRTQKECVDALRKAATLAAQS